MGYRLPSELASSSTVVVRASGSPAENGSALRAAYAKAKAMTPNGAAPAADNRATVLVGPGLYHLGTLDANTHGLRMDTEFVDLVGLTGWPEHVRIEGVSDGSTDSRGTIEQTADDVLLSGVTMQLDGNGINVYGDTSPAAYFPGNNLPNTALCDCVLEADNGAFPTRPAVEYSGTYIRCTGGAFSFGFYGGAASGTFTDCVAASESFGQYCPATGVFARCVADYYTFGWYDDAGGTFIDCRSTDWYTFGYAASGTFIRCSAEGIAFGLEDGLTGKLYHCRLTYPGASLPTPEAGSGGAVVLCIDGDDQVVTEYAA